VKERVVTVEPSCLARRAAILALGFLLLLGAPSLRADLGWVAFAAGGEAELPVRMEGSVVVLDAPDGPHRFPETMIRAFRPGESDEAAWKARRDEALRGGSTERFAASWWALEHGLTAECVEMLRGLRDADPDHRPSARMRARLGRLDAPCPDPDLAAIRAGLRGRFEVARGTHFVLLHQHSPGEAAERLDLLERVLATFYLSLSAHGIELELPPARLVAVWFASQADYLAQLRSEGATAFLTTQGYYHPTRGYVLTFDLRDDPGFRRRERELARASQRDGDRKRLLVDLDRRTQELGTAAHETIHQLVRVSGLAPRFETFPIWLHEGLAMQFEVVRGGRWAGVGRLHPLRVRTWRDATSPPELLPLIRDEGFGRGYDPRRYAHAWALVYFLRKRHPEQWLAVIDSLRSPGDETQPAGQRARQAFEIAFGPDLAPLEEEWHRFLAGLRLPSEENP
jgi:hypothetical protein